MKLTGKLDYLEMPATGGTLDRAQGFLQRRLLLVVHRLRADLFGLRRRARRRLPGRCRGSARQAAAGALFRGSGRNARAPSKVPAARSSSRSSRSPAAGASISSIRPAMNWRSGANSTPAIWRRRVDCQFGRSNTVAHMALCFSAALLITRRTSDSDGYWGVAKW